VTPRALPRRRGAGLCRLAVSNQTLVLLSPEPVSSSLHGSRFLAGALGGSITHQCFYSSTPANKHQRKYWCKVAASGTCYTIISSSFISSQYRGRVALGDTPQNGSFRVTMTGLSSSDSGTYRCGIGSTNEGLHVSLNLTVLPGGIWFSLGSWGRLGCLMFRISGKFTFLSSNNLIYTLLVFLWLVILPAMLADFSRDLNPVHRTLGHHARASETPARGV
uniref:Ig-like domain-containing protein n=1 Tax=Ficedula albicollis TaxID=59894 RepID=A0A803VRM9_FICAL